MARRGRSRKVRSEEGTPETTTEESPKDTKGGRRRRSPSRTRGGGRRQASPKPAVYTGLQPSYDDTPLGLGNVTREFTIYTSSGSQRTLPTIAYTHVTPCANWLGGWNEVNNVSNPEPNSGYASLVTATTDPDEELYAMLTKTSHWANEIWPTISNILESGLGTRAAVSRSAFVRYICMLLRSYQYAYQKVVANHLAFRFDWEQVFPFTSNPPTSIFEYVKAQHAYDTDLAETWLPLMQRIEAQIMFPNLLVEVRRMMTPMISADLNGRLILPHLRATPNEDASDDAVFVEAWLDYISSILPKQTAAIKTFLPFPVNRQMPWSLMPIATDLDRYTGMYNSGLASDVGVMPYGDTGDPNPTSSAQYWIRGSSNPGGVTEPTDLSFLTRKGQPSWGEIRHTTIWEMTSNLADDTFRVMTEHLWGPRTFWDDLGTTHALGANNKWFASPSMTKLQPFANSKFAFADALTGDETVLGGVNGIADPGYLYASIPGDGLERLCKLEVEKDWSYKALRMITTAGIGSSLREIRELFEVISTQHS